MTWKIKYCSSSNYKPQAERLSAEMNELGFNTTIEEGNTGQFELYRLITVENSDYWTSYMTGGNKVPKVFTLRDVELKLSGL